MLKLNAGFSRKVGEANYGSRGASVQVELELESNLTSDPDGLMGRIRGLFDLARWSVDAELNGSAQPAAESSSTSNNGHQKVRLATVSQLRAIRAICRRRGLDPDRLGNERFGVGSVDELTLTEASTLIDELKAVPAASAAVGGNGGAR